MSTLKSVGTRVMTAMIATGLVAGTAFAGNLFTVTLPQAVTVGNATLASGQYTITESSLRDGSKLFVFRSEKGEATSAMASKSAEPSADQKTEVVFSNDNGMLHLDKMFIEGDSAGYQFAGAR